MRLEKDLEDILWEQEFINVNGIEVELLERQYNINGYIIDLIGIGVDDSIYIFELKRGVVDGNALSQILAYKDTIEKLGGFFKADTPEELTLRTCINYVLVGQDMNDYTRLAINQTDVIFLKYHEKVDFECTTFYSTIENDEKGVAIVKRFIEIQNQSSGVLESVEDEPNQVD